MGKVDIRTIHFTAVAIGVSDLTRYLTLTLPSMLARDNLPALVGREHKFHLYASHNSAAAIGQSPVVQRLLKLISVETHVLDDLIPAFRDSDPYDVLERCFSHAARSAAGDGGAITPIWPGTVFSNGSVARLERFVSEGREDVAAFFPDVAASRVVTPLTSRFAQEDGVVVTVGSRDLVQLLLEYPSPLLAQHFVDSPFFPRASPVAAWRVGDQGVVIRSTLLYPVLAFPLADGRLSFKLAPGTCGHHFVVEWLPDHTTATRVIDDSDGFCVVSVDDGSDTPREFSYGPRPDFVSMASRICESGSPSALAFLHSRLRFVAREPNTAWEAAEEEADCVARAITDQVAAYAWHPQPAERVEPVHPESDRATVDDVALRVNRLVAGWVLRGKRVVVYAAASHTLRLANSTDLCRANIVGIADSDPRVHGRTVLGHAVVSADRILGLQPDVVLCSPDLDRDESDEWICELERNGVELVRLYRQASGFWYSGHTAVDDVIPRLNRLVEGWVLRSKRIAVFAASLHTRMLADESDLCRANIVGVADSDTRLRGETVLGHTVVSPEHVMELRPDAILISSGVYQNEIYERLADLEYQGVELVRLYYSPEACAHYTEAVRLMGESRPREAWEEYRQCLVTSQDADQIKDAAVCLCEGLGRMNDALALFQRSDEVRRRRASTRAWTRTNFRILDLFWVSAIGHLAQIDYMLKLGLLEGRDPQDTILYVPGQSRVANRFLLEQYRPLLRLVERADDLPIPRNAISGLSLNFYAPPVSEGGPVFLWERAADTYQRWHAAGRGPLFRLSDEVSEKGWSDLERAGLPRNCWFVGLHVREPGFRAHRREVHNVLNASIEDYLPAIREITRRGGWVVRMGDPTMTPLPPMDHVLDYCLSPIRSDWMDVFLSARCRFFVGTSSGPVYVAQNYGVPCVLTNWWSHAKRPWQPGDTFVPKLIRRQASGERLTLRESLVEPFGYPDSVQYLRASHGVEVDDSDPEDIRAAVAEMCEVVDQTIRYEPKDVELRAQADRIYRSMSRGLYGSPTGFGASRLARDFLRRHEKFLA